MRAHTMKDEEEHVPHALGGVVGGGVAVPDRRQRLRHHIHRDAVGLQLAYIYIYIYICI